MVSKMMLQNDPQVAKLIHDEFILQQNILLMNASENITSQIVKEACGSVFIDRVAEGLVGNRYHSHCDIAEEIEKLAISRAKELIKEDLHVNVQPHSGTNANLAVYKALLKKGDKVLSMDIKHGGHLSHGAKGNFSGSNYSFLHYGVNPKTQLIDIQEIEDLTKKNHPRLIIAGASSYPRQIDFEKIAKIAHENDALFMVDIAHIFGLVVTGLHPSPFPFADVVTSSTQKTMPGPRGGVIFCRKELSNKIDLGVFPGTISDPHMHIIAGKAVVFGEALKPEFKKYQKNILNNANTLAQELLKYGYSLVSGGTDNHLVLIDLRNTKVNGKEAQKFLEMAGISSNMNMIPFDPCPPASPSGLRLGTPALTTLGFNTKDIKIVASMIDKILKSNGNEKIIREVHQEVKLLRLDVKKRQE